jgi:hypothetical protein
MPSSATRSKDLLNAIKQMAPEEFDTFLDEALHVRQQGRAATLSAAETKLIKRINCGLPLDLCERYAQLTELRKKGVLTKGEHQELLRLSDEAESRDCDRAEALVALAKLRGLPLRTLMKQMAIKAPPTRG